MPIPFPPDGPQVQAAMSKMPGGVLQNYAAGTPPQPTGQATPGPGGAPALALADRGFKGAASQRQSAMNNKVSDSTIFQQKDMQIQQAMQALQQKEQQLGLASALMAKKAQELQAREMGVANLPIRPDMFTAMDGGIVFADGGGVEGYASKGMVGQYTPSRPGLLALAGLEKEEPLPEVEEDPIRSTIGRIRSGVAELEEAEKSARLSPEEKKRRLEEAETKDRGQYEKFKQGIAGLDEQTVKAILGKEPDLLSGVVAGIPTERGRRVSDVILGMAKGVNAQQAAYGDRASKAAMYMAEAKRKQALADFEEERGRPERAKKLVADAESDLAKAFELRKSVISTALGAEQKIGDLQLKEEVAKTQAEARQQIAAADRRSREQIADARNEILLAKVRAEIAKSGAGGKTDLQTRANVAYEVLKEENAKLPPDQRKSDARLRNEAYGLAETALLGSRRTSAAASMLRAEVFNSKTLSEAMNRLRYDPAYIEASATEKRELEDAVRARFPASSAMPSGAIPYPQRSNAPPPPPGFVPNSR